MVHTCSHQFVILGSEPESLEGVFQFHIIVCENKDIPVIMETISLIIPFVQKGFLMPHFPFTRSYREKNRLVSQMRAPLAACREPAGKLWQLCKVWYVFEHKMQFIF